jgi:hypothetical protein
LLASRLSAGLTVNVIEDLSGTNRKDKNPEDLERSQREDKERHKVAAGLLKAS